MGRRLRKMGSSSEDRWERHRDKTFEEAVRRYLDDLEGKTLQRQIECLSPCLPYVGDVPLVDIDEETLREYKKERHRGLGPFKKPVMAGTINKELGAITAVLNRACKEWRWIPSVPKIRRVKGAKRQPYPLTWDEQTRLFNELPKGWGRGVALFAVNTGLRKGELFGLRWDDEVEIPEIDSSVFILYDGETKNGHARAVILNSLARQVIERQRFLTKGLRVPWVFPSAKGKKVKAISTPWNEAWVRAGLPDHPLVKKGIHNLRHTFGQRLRAAGVWEEDRDALLGHSNKSLTQHYATPDIQRLTELAERVTERTDAVILRPTRMAVEAAA